MFTTLQVMSVVSGAAGLPVRRQLQSGGERSLGPRFRAGLASLPQEPGRFVDSVCQNGVLHFLSQGRYVSFVDGDFGGVSVQSLQDLRTLLWSHREIALDHCAVQDPIFCQAWLRDEAGLLSHANYNAPAMLRFMLSCVALCFWCLIQLQALALTHETLSGVQLWQ